MDITNLNNLKCSNCGGILLKNESIYLCKSCGSTFEEKQIDSKIFVGLTQAENERNSAEFEKSKEILKKIIEIFPNDDLSEVYWNLLLSSQNVIFEKDGKGEMFPSFYRINNDSVLQSPYFLKTLEYCQKYNNYDKEIIFKSLAEKIDNAKKMYLDIKQNTKPYDIFICFKKSDEFGQTTKDTQLAQDIYNELSNDYKIFFSEKSLINIKSVYRNYEPNIYYALYTSKILLLICSKKEYLESTWLKNEWKRFNKINTKDSNKKCIIPIFMEGFDPNDLPNELWHNQGIFDDRKLISNLKEQLSCILNPTNELEILKQQQEELKSILEHSNNNQTQSNISPLIKRAEMFLEDKDFDNANQYAERILDINPVCFEAYLIKLLCELEYTNFEQLKNGTKSIHNANIYQKVLKFASNDKRLELEKLAKTLEEREKFENIYIESLNYLQNGKDFNDCISAINGFSKIPNYKDSNYNLYLSKQKIYNVANHYLQLKKYDFALKCFCSILDFEDANQKLLDTQELIYVTASQDLDNKNYTQAVDSFTLIHNYKDSTEKLNMAKILLNETVLQDKYNLALNYASQKPLSRENIISARNIFDSIKDYKDSRLQIEKLNKKLSSKKYKIFTIIVSFCLVIIASIIFLPKVSCAKQKSELFENLGIKYFNNGAYYTAMQEFTNTNQTDLLNLATLTKQLSEIDKDDSNGSYTNGVYSGTNKDDEIVNIVSQMTFYNFNVTIKYCNLDYIYNANSFLATENYNNHNKIESLYYYSQYKKIVGWFFGNAFYDSSSNTCIICLNPNFIDKDDTPFTIKTYLENLEDDDFTFYESVTYYGELNSRYSSNIIEYDGFYRSFTSINNNLNLDEEYFTLDSNNLDICVYYVREICVITRFDNTSPNNYGHSFKYGTSFEKIYNYNPSRQGYTFGGWFTDINLVTLPPSIITDSFPVYVWWKEETKPCDLIWEENENDDDSIFFDTLTVKGVSDNFTNTKVVVPTYIGGKRVTKLSKNGLVQSWNGVVELTVPYYLEHITLGAFANCDTLKNITFDLFTSIKINESAFYNCYNLENVYYNNHDFYEWGFNTFANSTANPMSMAKNFYLYESYESKNYIKPTTLFWSMENDVNAYAYYNFKQLEVLHLSTPQKVGTAAFANLDNLKEVWFHQSTTYRWLQINFEDTSANPLNNPSVEKFYINYGYNTMTTNWQELENFRQILGIE